jgi:tripartite-type tricarboxylate transporter receptor subunit TctC
VRFFLIVFSILAFESTAAADWPARPVKVIVPYPPGGTSDMLGRVVAQKLSEAFGESFVVENRPGAGGALGSELVAKAAPDGYTLLVSGVGSHAVAPAQAARASFDPVRDFTHIALFGGPPAVLVVNPSVPAASLGDFVALLKKNPGKYSYGSPGTGTQAHLVVELFKRVAGVEIEHVPYKGGAGAMTDLIAGHIPVASTTLSTAAGQIHAGKARALAVSSAARLRDYPDVPTFVEAGYRGVVATIWFSLSGPARLPEPIVGRLNAEVRKALQLPDVREKLRPEGIEPGRMEAGEFAAFLADEVRRWGPIVRASGASQ